MNNQIVKNIIIEMSADNQNIEVIDLFKLLNKLTADKYLELFKLMNNHINKSFDIEYDELLEDNVEQESRC